jgi:hypothetical protein
MEGHQIPFDQLAFDHGQFSLSPQQNTLIFQTEFQANSGFANTYPLHGIEYPGLNDVMCGRGTWSSFGTKLSMTSLSILAMIN